MNKLAIIVVSCDKYSDLWDDMFNLLDIHWADRPYETYLATDTKPFEHAGVKVIHFGNIRQWMVCTRKAVEEIDAPYILFLMEDYFVIKDIDSAVIEEDLALLEKMGGDFINIHQRPYYLNEKDSLFVSKDVRTIPNNTRYGLDTAGAIWKKSFFLEQLNRAVRGHVGRRFATPGRYSRQIVLRYPASVKHLPGRGGTIRQVYPGSGQKNRGYGISYSVHPCANDRDGKLQGSTEGQTEHEQYQAWPEVVEEDRKIVWICLFHGRLIRVELI